MFATFCVMLLKFSMIMGIALWISLLTPKRWDVLYNILLWTVFFCILIVIFPCPFLFVVSTLRNWIYLIIGFRCFFMKETSSTWFKLHMDTITHCIFISLKFLQCKHSELITSKWFHWGVCYTETKHLPFLKIKFANKGIYALNLSKYFESKIRPK